jgi:quercetin dioxygenase-like cupin family protein
MKKFLLSFAFPALCLPAVAAESAGGAPSEKLTSNVFAVDQLPATPTPVGVRRPVFDAPTATVSQTHCHVTTLNAGASSGAPRKHVQEEIIVIKEGTVEAHWDGQSKVAKAGDVIFFAANAVTHLRNIGDTPATYYVIYYFTPLTAKE